MNLLKMKTPDENISELNCFFSQYLDNGTNSNLGLEVNSWWISLLSIRHVNKYKKILFFVLFIVVLIII